MFGITAFPFLLLVSFLFLINIVEPISRHRHTFFFEENALDAFTEDTIQILGKHAVRIRNFSGIREWKVITTPEELVKQSVTQSTWSKNWTLRVQIASGTQTLFYPFNITPIPGIHIGISLGNQTFVERLDYKNSDFLAICRYLDALLGVVMCDKASRMYNIDLSNSIFLPGENIYYYSPISHYHQIPSSSSVLGRRFSLEYDSLPAIIDLHFNFDKNTNQTKADLRMIWKYRNQDIEIDNQDIQDDKIELGVFGPQLDSESFIGARVIFGTNDEPKPTMINVLPRILPIDSFFNSSISPSQSFHPHFSTSIKYSIIEDKCKDHILYILPNSFFVDVYQLKDKFSDEQIKVWGETDLENPVGVTSLNWGSLVLVTRQNSENLDNFEFSLPLHMRYQPGNIQRSHVSTAAPWPFVIRVCENIENDIPEPLFAPTPLPLSLLFPSTTEIKYILPKQRFLQGTSWLKEEVKVPVGQLGHLKFVEWWTIIIALSGCAWVVWITVKKVSQWKYEDDDKID